MGIIQKQAVAGTIYTYLGVGLGFITTGLLMPHLMSTDEIGVIKLLTSFSVLFGTVGNLGTVNVITKLFPYFKNEANGHHGFLFNVILLNIVGMIIVTSGYYALKPWLISSNTEKSKLFIEYIPHILPLIYTYQFFNIFDAYFRSIHNAIKGTIAKDILQRTLQVAILIAYAFIDSFDFTAFVYGFVLINVAPLVYLIASAGWNGYLHLKPDFQFISPTYIKQIIFVGLLGTLSGLSQTLILQVDSLMVNYFKGVDQTGIYAISFFFATLVVMPSRMLRKVGGAHLSEAWKAKDLQKILSIYKKSTINQLLIGLFIFLMIWINIENVYQILPQEYALGKYAILFLCIANTIEMAAGLSIIVITTSDKYYYATYFIILFVIAATLLNYMFIPQWGISGAAFASLLAISIYTILKYAYLLKRYRFQPFSAKHLLAVCTGSVFFALNYFMPDLGIFYIDLPVRSAIIGLGFSTCVFFLNISPEFTELVKNTARRIATKRN